MPLDPASPSEPPAATTPNIVSPRAHKSPSAPSIGELSVIQRSSTTVEVRGHDATFPSFLDTSEYFYDSRAGVCTLIMTIGDGNLTVKAVYENPLITATSRAFISDIHVLTRRCCAVDVPRPLSILYAILRTRPPHKRDPWFKAIRIWAEVDDISETESFDGHKKSFVDYTLNVLFFPDLHTTYRVPKTLMLRRPPTSPAESQFHFSVPDPPSLLVPGTPISVPSPLHFQLPVMTRLCFNEQGQITYHRDVWDLRDVVRLIPGVRVVLWIMARAGAWGLSWISQTVCSGMDSDDAQHDRDTNGDNGLLTSPSDLNI